MDLRRTLSRDGQVCAIKHGLFGSHVVIDDLEDDNELADNHLTSILLVPEESQVLPDAHALGIRQLAHHLAELDHALSQKPGTAIGIITLIRDYKRCELELRVLRHLDFCNRQEESVGREDWILHSC